MSIVEGDGTGCGEKIEEMFYEKCDDLERQMTHRKSWKLGIKR